MAQGFQHHGRYNNHRGNASAFDRDASHLKPPRAAEGENAGEPKHPDYAGGRTDRRKPVDGDLTSSGGNTGFTGKQKSWS
jgi:hypothetical protein